MPTRNPQFELNATVQFLRRTPRSIPQFDSQSSQSIQPRRVFLDGRNQRSPRIRIARPARNLGFSQCVNSHNSLTTLNCDPSHAQHRQPCVAVTSIPQSTLEPPRQPRYQAPPSSDEVDNLQRSTYHPAYTKKLVQVSAFDTTVYVTRKRPLPDFSTAPGEKHAPTRAIAGFFVATDGPAA